MMRSFPITTYEILFHGSSPPRLAAGWEDGSGFECVYELLAELLDKLGEFFSNAEKRKQFLAPPNGIDLLLVKQMIRHRAYDTAAFVDTVRKIVQMLSKLESPYQHSLTQKHFSREYYQALETLESPQAYANAIVDALQYLFRQLDTCHAEMDNFYLAMIAPADRVSML